MMLDVAALVISLALRHGVTDEPRLRRVADDITAASSSTAVFCGPAADDALALTLTGIAWHESGFRSDVQSCTWSTDRQYTLWQLHGPVAMGGHTKAEVCDDNALAATLAARLLARMRGCGSLDCMMRGYASGDTHTRSRAATELVSLISLLFWNAGLIVGYRNGCLEARAK